MVIFQQGPPNRGIECKWAWWSMKQARLAQRESMRRSMPLEILLSHSTSFEIMLMSTECVSFYFYFTATVSPSLTISEIMACR